MALPNGRTSSFLERLRSPNTMGGSSWQYRAPTSAIRVGEQDPIQNAQNMIKWERDRDYATSLQQGGNYGGGWGGQQPRGLQQIGQNMSPSGQMGGAMNSNPSKMDVVYDQGPELMQKQLNLQKDMNNAQMKDREIERTRQSGLDNDAYIDNRRKLQVDTELGRKQAETLDWSARNLRPGEMDEREKLQAELASRHADRTQQSLGRWLDSRERANAARDVAAEAGQSRRDVAQTQADARRDVKNAPETQSKQLSYRLQELAVQNPTLAQVISTDDKGNAYISPEAAKKYPALAQQVSDALYPKSKPGEVMEELNRLSPPGGAPVVAQPPQTGQNFGSNIPNTGLFVPRTPVATGRSQSNPNIPMNPDANPNPLMGGFGSAALGGQMSSPGLRGNAPIDQGATANPYAANQSNQPGSGMYRTQTNKTTGQRRESRDGGLTWQIIK